EKRGGVGGGWRCGQKGWKGSFSANLIAFTQPSCITIVNALRLAGWRVGAHNDFRIEQEQAWCTFWMWRHPKNGRYIESEGTTDLEALSRCHASMVLLG